MRYYNIVITNPKTGAVVKPPGAGSLNVPSTYTSAVQSSGGLTSLSSALDIELDIFIAPLATPVGGSYVRIWGISLNEIEQASNLNGFNISVYGGMQKGLPLANPKQSGLLIEGMIFQAFGNWVGTDMTLDLILNADVGTIATPKNLVHNWTQGTPLKDAIQATLSTAFPGKTVNISISDKVVLTQDVDIGFYQTAGQYAQYIKALSKDVVNDPNYLGVDILVQQNGFSVYDATTQTTPKQIEFQDLIGQPTWIGPKQMQFKTVMRADISSGDFIKMPKGLVTTTAAAQSSLTNLKTSFQGTFLVTSERAIGRYRQPDAASWVTVFDAAALSDG